MNTQLKQQVYATLCEESPDAILFADREGLIQFWNRGAETIFGYSAAEAIGRPLELIIPEKLQQRHNDGYQAVTASGTTKYGSDLLSVPARHKDGSRLFSDFSIVMVKDAAGQMQGIAAIMRDSTAQKIKEKELKERINQLEAAES
jgi:PAS domain S-box-containing protein